jgi:peptidoglycan/LPS O-acetylase OafA/YrhL
MFYYIEKSAGVSPIEILGHALIVFSLLQAWNPQWGLLWNSPTWFLSAWLFANALFPKSFLILKKLPQKRLFFSLFSIFTFLLIVRIYYSTKVGFCGLEELRKDLNWNTFNLHRFSPILNSLEFIAGIIVGILFTRDSAAPRLASFYSYAFGVLLVSVIVLRLWFPLNDLLSRTVFIPLFLAWIYYLSFEKGILSSILKTRALVYLGNISFSIYIVHGALGQLFYKRVVRAWLGHEAPSFFLYLAVLFVCSALLYHFVEAKKGKG